jgi:hypothetical protein
MSDILEVLATLSLRLLDLRFHVSKLSFQGFDFRHNLHRSPRPEDRFCPRITCSKRPSSTRFKHCATQGFPQGTAYAAPLISGGVLFPGRRYVLASLKQNFLSRKGGTMSDNDFHAGGNL